MGGSITSCVPAANVQHDNNINTSNERQQHEPDTTKEAQAETIAIHHPAVVMPKEWTFSGFLRANPRADFLMTQKQFDLACASYGCVRNRLCA